MCWSNGLPYERAELSFLVHLEKCKFKIFVKICTNVSTPIILSILKIAPPPPPPNIENLPTPVLHFSGHAKCTQMPLNSKCTNLDHDLQPVTLQFQLQLLYNIF